MATRSSIRIESRQRDAALRELGFDPEATPSFQEVRRAFLKLAFASHPDRVVSTGLDPAQAGERFKRIRAAYELLHKKGLVSEDAAAPGEAAKEDSFPPEYGPARDEMRLLGMDLLLESLLRQPESEWKWHLLYVSTGKQSQLRGRRSTFCRPPHVLQALRERVAEKLARLAAGTADAGLSRKGVKSTGKQTPAAPGALRRASSSSRPRTAPSNSSGGQSQNHNEQQIQAYQPLVGKTGIWKVGSRHGYQSQLRFRGIYVRWQGTDVGQVIVAQLLEDTIVSLVKKADNVDFADAFRSAVAHVEVTVFGGWPLPLHYGFTFSRGSRRTQTPHLTSISEALSAKAKMEAMASNEEEGEEACRAYVAELKSRPSSQESMGQEDLEKVLRILQEIAPRWRVKRKATRESLTTRPEKKPRPLYVVDVDEGCVNGSSAEPSSTAQSRSLYTRLRYLEGLHEKRTISQREKDLAVRAEIRHSVSVSSSQQAAVPEYFENWLRTLNVSKDKWGELWAACVWSPHVQNAVTDALAGKMGSGVARLALRSSDVSCNRASGSMLELENGEEADTTRAVKRPGAAAAAAQPSRWQDTACTNRIISCSVTPPRHNKGEPLEVGSSSSSGSSRGCQLCTSPSPKKDHAHAESLMLPVSYNTRSRSRLLDHGLGRADFQVNEPL